MSGSESRGILTREEIILNVLEELDSTRDKIRKFTKYSKENILPEEERERIHQNIRYLQQAYRNLRDQLVVSGYMHQNTSTINLSYKFDTSRNKWVRPQLPDVPLSSAYSSNILGAANVLGTDFSSTKDAFIEKEDEAARKFSLYKSWYQKLYTKITANQAYYIHMYYNKGRSMVKIASLVGVNKSTVSRTITRGLNQMRAFTRDMELALKCDKSETVFDIVRFLYESETLTKTQKLYALIRYSTEMPTVEYIATIFKINKSTVSRTIRRALDVLVELNEDRKTPLYRTVITLNRKVTPEDLIRELGL